jgi:uncharacterized protein (DUF697 family)
MSKISPIIIEAKALKFRPKLGDELQRAKVDAAINYSVSLSSGASVLPVSMFEFVDGTAIRLALVKQLSSLFGVEYAPNETKRAISALVNGSFPSGDWMAVASVIKMIAVLGSDSGGAAVLLGSGASTYAIGKVFAHHFAQGGTIFDLDANLLKEQFNEHYEAGKRRLLNKKRTAESEKTSFATVHAAPVF